MLHIICRHRRPERSRIERQRPAVRLRSPDHMFQTSHYDTVLLGTRHSYWSYTVDIILMYEYNL